MDFQLNSVDECLHTQDVSKRSLGMSTNRIEYYTSYRKLGTMCSSSAKKMTILQVKVNKKTVHTSKRQLELTEALQFQDSPQKIPYLL